MNKSIALAALLAFSPAAVSADTTAEISVPGVYGYIRHLVVQTGVPLAISLPPGESIVSNPIIGDPAWDMKTALGGDGAHLTLKPMKVMPRPTLLQIYGSTRTWYLVVSSPDKVESTAYVVDFYNPRHKTSKEKTQTKQTVGCKSNDSRYQVNGDRRIIVSAVCEDERHTLIVVRMNRDSPNALPYSVDPTGRQDRIGNTTPAQVAPDTFVWTFDGKYRHLALLSDSNRGPIRTDIVFHGKP